MKNDRYFLKKAVEEGDKKPAPYNFGAVVVKDGEIVGADHGHVQETNDPAAHSEVSALRVAAQKLGNWQLDGCTLYCSHEPCVMCFSCAAWAHIDRIVYVTSKEEQHDFMYEFTDINLQDLARKLLRPMKVEQIAL